MQRCLIYEKTMAAETRNGGSSLNNNNNNCKDHSRRKLLVGVDLFCLFLGESQILSQWIYIFRDCGVLQLFCNLMNLVLL